MIVKVKATAIGSAPAFNIAKEGPGRLNCRFRQDLRAIPLLQSFTDVRGYDDAYSHSCPSRILEDIIEMRQRDQQEGNLQRFKKSFAVCSKTMKKPKAAESTLLEGIICKMR
jgi:hypothetical protein